MKNIVVFVEGVWEVPVMKQRYLEWWRATLRHWKLQRARLAGWGGNPTAEVADEFRRFLPQTLYATSQFILPQRHTPSITASPTV